jgi:hypothetical protein
MDDLGFWVGVVVVSGKGNQTTTSMRLAGSGSRWRKTRWGEATLGAAICFDNLKNGARGAWMEWQRVGD